MTAENNDARTESRRRPWGGCVGVDNGALCRWDWLALGQERVTQGTHPKHQAKLKAKPCRGASSPGVTARW